MLAIRMQRTGRKGHAQFRVVVQDSRLAPTSGRTVALLGSYNPHTKTATLEKDKAAFYLKNGAQPSSRVVSLFKSEGIKLPDWVKQEAGKKERSIRNADKLRRNRPAEEARATEAAETTDAEAVETEAPQSGESAAEASEPEAEKAEDKADKPAEGDEKSGGEAKE